VAAGGGGETVLVDSELVPEGFIVLGLVISLVVTGLLVFGRICAKTKLNPKRIMIESKTDFFIFLRVWVEVSQRL
jgi:hypothetical protein